MRFIGSTLIALIICLTSCSSEEENGFSDWKCFGLNGRVRSIKLNLYDIPINGEPFRGHTKDGLVFSQLQKFNEKGVLVEEFNTDYEKGEELFETRVEFLFQQGKKVGFVELNEYGMQLQRGRFTWSDDHHYRNVVNWSYGDVDTIDVELDQYYRNYKGIIKHVYDGKLEYKESYERQMEKPGSTPRSERVKWIDHITNEHWEESLENIRYDEKGNKVFFETWYSNDSTGYTVTTLKYEYYD